MALFVFPIVSLVSEIAVVALVITFRRRLPRAMQVLGAYFVLALIVGIVQLLLALNHVKNLLTLHLWLPIELIALLLVFYLALRTSVRVVLPVIMVIFLAAWILTVQWSDSLPSSYPYLKTAASVVLVAVACYTLVIVVRDEEAKWSAHPMFWVASATAVYYACTAVFHSLSSAILASSTETMRLAWSVQAVMNVIANMLYFRGFWCFRQK